MFASDLSASGFYSLAPSSEALEESLHFPEVRAQFDILPWKKEGFPYVFAMQVIQNKFQLVVFDIQKESAKKYLEIPLTGKLEKDRVALHRLSDLVQRDLFGIEGIASNKIIYSKRLKTDEGWSSEIWVCDADGFNDRAVISEKGYCVSPSFFPSQSEDFFYISFQEGQSKVYRSSTHKTVGEPMISLRGNHVLASMSPKRDQIAFICDAAGRPDLFVQNLDSRGKMVGKARQLFSAQRSTQASPTYSPDGKQIAFVSDKDGSPRIYVMDVASPKETKRPNPRLLTKANRENTSPSWSLDGKKLSYSAKVDGIRQIWLYDFATEQEKMITTGPENKENPSWAPDHIHLIYNTESDDQSELYRIHIGTRESLQISKGPGQKRFANLSSQE